MRLTDESSSKEDKSRFNFSMAISLKFGNNVAKVERKTDRKKSYLLKIVKISEIVIFNL